LDEKKLFNELINRISSDLNEEEISLIKKAYEFAKEAHKGQKRESDEPYIIHPLNVALVLSSIHVDGETYVAALLHDVLEDTETTPEEIKEQFGDDVLFLVQSVTKLKHIKNVSVEEAKLENLRRMLLAMASDVRVVLIKLADRLHNMRTLGVFPPDKQKRIAQETMDIYVPLAHRLGIYKVKWELEDLSFRYLDSDSYYDLARKVAKKRKEREEFIKQVMEELQHLMEENHIKAEVSGRPKNLYSIYRKMKRDNKTFDEIYDLTAVRIIVLDVATCYQVLGIVNNYYTPVPGRIKDYIAMPKPNLYQSLHTTVITKSGEPMEIQIRTRAMHKQDEIGIAAHWKYKEGIKIDERYEKKLVWLRQLLDWQKEIGSTKEFVERVKTDLFNEEVLVFTPKGEVVDLPVGATPVDFAYRIHTEVGNRCIGAKVNGKIVPLDTQLKTGDRVEILTLKTEKAPNADWLKFVKTASAKSKIKSYLRRQERIREGEEPKKEKKEEVEKKPQQVQHKKSVYPHKEEILFFPVVSGVRGIKISMAKCCNPEYPDRIVGYITRGRGVKIHRADCPNIKAILKRGGKIVPAEWKKKKKGVLRVFFRITAWNVPGILYKLSGIMADRNLNIENFHTSERKDKRKHGYVQVYIRFFVQMNGPSDVSSIAKEIRLIPEVINVRYSKRWFYESSGTEGEESKSTNKQ
jgi:guanosine-3',5'-bis(diphosphate) 3'-pyrophosphohydrolase